MKASCVYMVEMMWGLVIVMRLEWSLLAYVVEVSRVLVHCLVAPGLPAHM